MNWIDIEKAQPDLAGEYLVVWNMSNNEYPTTTMMCFTYPEKQWYDPQGDPKKAMNDEVLYWSDMPEAPEGIPRIVWDDSYRRSKRSQLVDAKSTLDDYEVKFEKDAKKILKTKKAK